VVGAEEVNGEAWTSAREDIHSRSRNFVRNEPAVTKEDATETASPSGYPELSFSKYAPVLLHDGIWMGLQRDSVSLKHSVMNQSYV